MAELGGRQADGGGEAASEGAGSAATPLASEGVRVGVLVVPSQRGLDFQATLARLNIASGDYFQTEVPDAFQLPLASKFLARSNTVDAIVVAHGAVEEHERAELLRSYQSVALDLSVPLVPLDDGASIPSAAEVAVKMGAMRRQALKLGPPKSKTGGSGGRFFGIGVNQTSGAQPKKSKVYF